MTTTRPDYPPTAGLDELLALARERYAVRFEPLKVGDHVLDLLQIEDMGEYVDRLIAQTGEANARTLPFWAKIWPTSLLLAWFIQRFPPDPERKVLEIGSGVGVCGLFAARHGFRTIISDMHPDALLFTRINILRNGLQDRAETRLVDFTADRLGECFDYILGSEVLYMEDTYRPLMEFLKVHLAPGGEAVLAKSYQRKALAFFEQAAKEFHIAEKTIGARPEAGTGANAPGDRHLSTIYRLRAR